MGLLNTLLGKPEPMGPAWAEFLQTRGLKSGQDIGQANVAKLVAEFTQEQQANTQAPGVAKQLGARFRTDPEAQSMVGLMMDPATRQQGVAGAMQMLAPQTSEQRARLSQDESQFQRSYAQADQQLQKRMAQDAAQFGQSFALDKMRTNATIANMDMDSAAKMSSLQIQLDNAGFTRENGLRENFNKNPLVLKAELALTSYQQLINALDQNDPTALGAAIVAITQVQEPGLAVREDDRIRYSGSNPLITQLVQMSNQAATNGRIDPLIDQRLRGLGTRLAQPHAQNFARVGSEYSQMALKTPGARPELVTAGTGIDPQLVQFLMSLDSGPQ